MQIFSDFYLNRMTAAFHEIFESALNSPAATTKSNVQTEKPLANPTIKALMRECDKTKQLALSNGIQWSKCKKFGNRVTMSMLEAVKDYYEYGKP